MKFLIFLKFGLRMMPALLANCVRYYLWWQSLSSFGPAYGYFTNATKTNLIVKPEYFLRAQTVFANTNIQITDRNQRHLGAVLGSREFAEEYVAKKVQSWVSDVSALARIADSWPHAAYTAFMHGLIGR